MFSFNDKLSARERTTIDKALAIITAHSNKNDIVTNSDLATEHFQLFLGTITDREVFAVAYLDSGLRIIETCIEFAGAIDEVFANPLFVARKALTLGATHVILAHNHPSGALEPSVKDKELTKQFQEKLGILEIKVCDHIIVTDTGTFSFLKADLL